MSAYATRRLSASLRFMTTPPTSDLCATSGDAVFSTTGQPISFAARLASSWEDTRVALVTGMP